MQAVVDQQRVTLRRKPDRRGASVEKTQRRAYEIYEARGSAPGHALDDWLQAERELRAESNRFESTRTASPDDADAVTQRVAGARAGGLATRESAPIRG